MEVNINLRDVFIYFFYVYYVWDLLYFKNYFFFGFL